MGLHPSLKFRTDAVAAVALPQDTSVRARGESTAPPPTDTTTSTTTTPPTPTGPSTPAEGCGTQQILMMVGMVAIFYFLLIRPSQKQEKARREMISKLKKGDRVVTGSGIHGEVAAIGDDTVQIRVDGEGRVKLTVDRSAIGRVVASEGTGEGGAKA